jgi:transcriptional regulator NrdR family protein
MDCPKCQTKSRVTKTCRDFSDHVRRYRKCPSCGHTFATKQPLEQIFESTHRHYQVYQRSDILTMRQLFFDEGRSSKEVAEVFGCTVSWVNKVVNYKVWTKV